MKQSLIYTFITAALFASCENSEKDVNRFSQRAIQKDVATKVVSQLSQGGKIRAVLTAPEMVRVQSDTVTTEFPKSLHVDFYNDTKAIESRLDAKYGKYYETIGKIYLRDSVKVVSINGDTLLCKDLWWDQNKEVFYTDKLARYRSPKTKLDGLAGLEATQDLKSVTFKQSVGNVKTESGEIPK